VTTLSSLAVVIDNIAISLICSLPQLPFFRHSYLFNNDIMICYAFVLISNSNTELRLQGSYDVLGL